MIRVLREMTATFSVVRNSCAWEANTVTNIHVFTDIKNEMLANVKGKNERVTSYVTSETVQSLVKV